MPLRLDVDREAVLLRRRGGDRADRDDPRAARGLGSTGIAGFSGKVAVLMEHANRGKKSLGLDLTSDEGRDILYRLEVEMPRDLTSEQQRALSDFAATMNDRDPRARLLRDASAASAKVGD